MNNKKHQFSRYPAQLQFKNQVLELRGKRLTSSLILLLLTWGFGFVAYKLWGEVISSFSIATALFCFLGFLSVYFSKAYLKYDKTGKRLKIIRKSISKSVVFNDRYDDQLSIELMLVPSRNNPKSYCVVLKAELSNAIVVFSLSQVNHLKESKTEAQNWSEKLNVPFNQDAHEL